MFERTFLRAFEIFQQRASRTNAKSFAFERFAIFKVVFNHFICVVEIISRFVEKRERANAAEFHERKIDGFF